MKERETLFLVLATLNHYSDVLRSNLILALTEKYHLIVFTPDIDAKKARELDYFAKNSIEYQTYSPDHITIWNFFNVYLRHALVRTFDDFFVTKYWYYKPGHPLRIRALIKLGSLLPKRFPSTSFFTAIEYALCKPSRKMKSLIQKYNPALVVTGTPGFFPIDAEFVVAAKRHGIPTVAIDLNIDNLTGKAKFMRETNYLMVWNTYMKKEALDYHAYTPEKVYVPGSLRLDYYWNSIKEKEIQDRTSFLLSKNLDPNKKTISYFTSTPVAYPAGKELMQIILDIKKNKLFNNDPNLLIRLHPNDLLEYYKEFSLLPNVHIELAGEERVKTHSRKGQKIEMTKKDQINLTETMLYSDVIINYSSTTTVEAMMFHTPVVSVGFPEILGDFPKGITREIYEIGMNKIIKDGGGMRVAYTPAEIIEHVNNYLIHPPEKEKFDYIFENFVHYQDGLSWKRTADAIDEIINKKL